MVRHTPVALLLLLAASSAAAQAGKMLNVPSPPGQAGKPPPAVKAALARQGTDDMKKLLATADGDKTKLLELVNVEWGGKHPIDVAVMGGNLEMVKLLVDAGAQLQNPGASESTGRAATSSPPASPSPSLRSRAARAPLCPQMVSLRCTLQRGRGMSR